MNNLGDTLRSCEVTPSVYQCGCRWIRAEEDEIAFAAGVRGNVLQLCPIHKQWNERIEPIMTEPQNATVGRIVHYIYQESDLGKRYQHLVGEVRPAIVVRVLPDVFRKDDGTTSNGYNLQVFTDAHNDGFDEYTIWLTSIELVSEASEAKPGTCHWPPRV
jgi:hypothetical protein